MRVSINQLFQEGYCYPETTQVNASRLTNNTAMSPVVPLDANILQCVANIGFTAMAILYALYAVHKLHLRVVLEFKVK